MRFLGGGIGHSYMRELEREFPGFLPGVDFNTGEVNLAVPDDQLDTPAVGPFTSPTDAAANVTSDTEVTSSDGGNKDEGEVGNAEDDGSGSDGGDEGENNGDSEDDESGWEGRDHEDDEGDSSSDEGDGDGDGDGDEQSETLEGELGFGAL